MKFTYNKKEYELILLTLAGSRLYGNNRPDSDWDYRGIFIASNEDKLGILGNIEEINSKDLYNILKKELLNNQEDVTNFHESDDIVLYEINKFFKLATDNNPNIIDILFADAHLNPSYAEKESIIYSNYKWKMIAENRDLFISKKTKFTFSGYGYAQLKRLEGHYKWLKEYPDINIVYNDLRNAWKNNIIDFNYVKDVFSGELAQALRNEFGDNKININPNIKIEDKYKKPHVINYCTLKYFDHSTIKINENIITELTFFAEYCSKTEYESLTSYLIYVRNPDENYPFNGIFSRERNIKLNGLDENSNIKLPIPRYILLVNKKEYAAALKKYEQMWSWKLNRNKDRSLLENKVGYDPKHASHLIRLLIKGISILETGTYNPKLTLSELQIINKIKNGKVDYKGLIDLAYGYETDLNELYNTSTLKKEPKRKEINNLLLDILLHEIRSGFTNIRCSLDEHLDTINYFIKKHCKPEDIREV